MTKGFQSISSFIARCGMILRRLPDWAKSMIQHLTNLVTCRPEFIQLHWMRSIPLWTVVGTAPRANRIRAVVVELARRAEVQRIILNGTRVTDILEPGDVDCV